MITASNPAEEVIFSHLSPHRWAFLWLEKCHHKGSWEVPLDTPADFLAVLETEIEESPESVITLDEVPAAIEAAAALREALGLPRTGIEPRWH